MAWRSADTTASQQIACLAVCTEDYGVTLGALRQKCSQLLKQLGRMPAAAGVLEHVFLLP